MKNINFSWENRIGIGVMTGTSCDGIDISAVQFSGNSLNEFNVIVSKSYSYPSDIKEFVKKCLTEKITLAELSQFNYFISEVYGQALTHFTEQYLKLSPDFVAVHGQTIWHNPSLEEFLGKLVSSTYQAINISALAKKIGVPVIGDFRAGDIALKGQGAPLVPIFDYYTFRSNEKSRICVNIGGISNITILPKKCTLDDIIAFDCGPGNVLIDTYVKEHFNKPYDQNGEIALSGLFNKELFYNLIENDNYQKIEPPKSTGREYYNSTFINESIDIIPHVANPNDMLNTLTHYTAYIIANNVKKYSDSSYEIIVSGGGARNNFLMDCLKNYLRDYTVNTTEQYEINPDFKESIAFAFLGYLFLNGEPGNIPSATGATKETILGTLAL